MNTTAFENPELRHLNHAPYQLAHLLLDLPRNSSGIKKTDKEMRQKAEVAVEHASNARLTLLFGLQAIGSLLFVAGTNKDYDLEEGELADLGCLIRHLASEVHTMVEIEEEFDKVEKGGA